MYIFVFLIMFINIFFIKSYYLFTFWSSSYAFAYTIWNSELKAPATEKPADGVR